MLDFMNKQNSKSLSLKAITYQNEEFRLQILVHYDLSPNATFLKLVSRQTIEEILIPIEEVTEENGETFFIVEIGKDFLPDLVSEMQFWDFYIVMKDEEEPNQYRLKSNFIDTAQLLYVDEKNEMMLYPCTTNKGNVSFNSVEFELIAKVENTSLTNEGFASLEGYVINPFSKDVPKRTTMKLLFSDDVLGLEKRVELDNAEQKNADIYIENVGKYDITRFKVNFDVNELFPNVDEKISIKLYIEFHYKEGENQIEMKSTAIKFETSGKYITLYKKIKHLNGKKKVQLGRTKSEKLLIINIGDYRLKEEMISKVKSKLNNFKQSSFTKKLYKGSFTLIGKLPAKKNLVIFESFLGKQYSDNPRAIYEYLSENYAEYQLVWSVDKRFTHNFEHKGLVYVKRFSFKWLFMMARAKYWVTNSRMPLWIPKPRHCTYLQTWHGTPLKRLAVDMDEVHMPGTSTQRYKENFIKESSNWDFLISPNGYSTEIFRRAFQFEKEMIESGYPRNDYLYLANNSDTINKIKQTYDIPLDKKVILYAPTWRDNQFYAVGKYKFDLDLDLSLMREKLGDEYVIILRMHYLVSENFDLGPYEGFAFDFSNHEDIRDLYLISDLLITDYSSVFFDYANLKRPMIFYVYDIDMYRDKLRGFYFDFENQAPGPLVKTTKQVIDTIKEIESEEFQVPISFNSFYEKFCYLESGQSSKRVVEKVFLGRKFT
jgi:CDP-glycerol glycerophosphotransferase